MAKFIFTNMLGSFVFDENCSVIDQALFKDIDQYKNKKQYQEKLIQKHKGLAEPDDRQLFKILSFFKNREYFSEFHKKNLELTKKSIKESVNNGLFIVQTASIIGEIDKTLNLLTKRLREWYSLYNPEASDKIKDHEKFSSLIAKKSKKQLLKELNIDEKDSIGADLREKDISAILLLAAQINSFYVLRAHYETYIKELEKEACPNLAAVVGITTAAKLIEHTGSR